MKEPEEIFHKFSPHTRKILISAQKIAKNSNSQISSEHILLALAITSGTLSYSILQEHMISLDQIRLIISLQPKANLINKITLSEDAKEILQKSALYAKEFGHEKIDPEHLLMAIVTSESSGAYKIISKIGTDPEIIDEQLIGLFEDIREVESRSANLPSKMQFNFPKFNNFSDLSMPNIPLETPLGDPQVQEKNILDYFTINLSKQAEGNHLDPLIGREKEIRRTIHILLRRTKNNPVLVGEPGVGKTAIIEGLAQKINDGQVPSALAGKVIIMLDLALLVAGTMYRGQFEDRIKKVMEELDKLGNVILFIDELHTVIGAGSAEGSLDAANILKPALSKGKIRLIGATTTDEYRKVIEKDSALERRFQKVVVAEPSISESISILKGLRRRYEEFHKIVITDEAIAAAVHLSKRYIADRFLPDKAIDLIDEASAAYKIKYENKDNVKINNLNKQLQLIRNQKTIEVEKQNYQKAAEIKELECRIEDELASLKQVSTNNVTARISSEDISRVVSLWTNIPVGNLLKTEKNRYLNLSKLLKKSIVGQDDAIKQITRAIRRSKSGIADPNRPIGSFIFLGPTGVGKTELALVLAEELFGTKEDIIKIDMSEFMEKHNVSRLLGAPPGYVGYDEAGKLTEQVRRQPYSIILFDEIEKAHPDIFNILLQILEDGQITDAHGRKINFRNTIIILTSNIGVKELNQQAVIGFQTKGKAKIKANTEYGRMKADIIKRLKDELRPELINRLDNVIVFRPLSKQDIKKIIILQLAKLSERLDKQGYKIQFAPCVIEKIAQNGFDPQYGARPVRRAISDLIEDPLSEQILSGKISKDDKILVTIKNSSITFNQKSQKSGKI